MSKETSHLEFAPPQELGGGGSLALALFVHALLLMALTWGIHWRTDPQEDIMDAELWAAIPEPVALKSDAPALPKNETDTKSTAPAVKKDAPPPAKITGNFAPANSSAAADKEASPPGPRSTRWGLGISHSISP